MMVWVPLLACPAVFFMLALLDKPAVVPTRKPVIAFENSYKTEQTHSASKCSCSRGKRGAAFTPSLSFFCQLFLYAGKLFSVANL
jgi:hypothetical protein